MISLTHFERVHGVEAVVHRFIYCSILCNSSSSLCLFHCLDSWPNFQLDPCICRECYCQSLNIGRQQQTRDGSRRERERLTYYNIDIHWFIVLKWKKYTNYRCVVAFFRRTLDAAVAAAHEHQNRKYFERERIIIIGLSGRYVYESNVIFREEIDMNIPFDTNAIHNDL